MSKIKVLQLGSPSGLYGAERWILALVNNLNSSKIESLVGAVRDSRELSTVPLCVAAEKAGFSTNTIESYGRCSFAAPSLLRKVVVGEGIDILHTHGYKTDLLGLLAVRGTSCKIISTPHGWTNKPDFKLRCYELLDRVLFQFFDAVVPLSQELYASLDRIPGMGKRLQLIQNGVDTKEIESVDSVASEMQKLRSEGAFILGYIGRLTPGKGLDVLLHSIADYGAVNWRLVVIGEGEQDKELKKLVEELNLGDRVHFLGFRADRLSFLKGFDVFILPSRSEGIPRCVMEAMAAGVAVVASDIPGCRHLVKHKKTGLLFEKDNARHLATAIEEIASSVALKEELEKAGYDLIYSHYSAGKMAAEYHSLYTSLCGG